MNMSSPDVELAQYSDNQSYSNTIRMISHYDPMVSKQAPPVAPLALLLLQSFFPCRCTCRASCCRTLKLRSTACFTARWSPSLTSQMSVSTTYLTSKLLSVALMGVFVWSDYSSPTTVLERRSRPQVGQHVACSITCAACARLELRYTLYPHTQVHQDLWSIWR